MKAHARALFHPKDLDTRRHRRAVNRRIKPAWHRSFRCRCVGCLPWYVPANGPSEEPSGPRALRLRLHALHLMEELAAFSPRLVGALAEPDDVLPFFEGLELEVAADDLSAVSRHLAGMGYRIERLRDGARVGFEATLLEPVVFWTRRDPDRPEGLAQDELETLLDAVTGRGYRTNPVIWLRRI